MKSQKVHRIVEYIRLQAEFPFDSDEVIEELDKILHFFDIHEELTGEEKELLEKDLSKLAIEEEFREMENIAEKQDPYIAIIRR